MFKSILATCLVVAVKAEADAFYGAYGHGYGLGYAGHLVAGVPFGSSTGLDPITQGLDASTQGYAPYAHHGVYYGKRSAHAQLAYALPYAHAYGYGLHAYGKRSADAQFYGYGAITQGLDASTQGYAPYAHHGVYYGKRSADAQLAYALPYAHAYGYGLHAYGKRSADAQFYGYAPYAHAYGYGLHAYGKRSADAQFYGYGALPYAHHAVVAHVPFGSSTGLDPITQGLDASTQGFAPYAHHGVYYGKRSADAQLAYALPYAHHAVAHVPFGSSTGLDPITQGLDASTQGYAPYAHYGYGLHGAYLG